MTRIKGNKVIIRDLEREDVDAMQNWGRHEDPLLFHYNFPVLTSREADEWYRIKTAKIRKKCFAIEGLDKSLIGYLSIRDIKWLKRESELGIVLDPSNINHGYGSEAIKLFLEHYFNELKMHSIKLRTAKYNKRAIKCYENCGFIKVKETLEEFEDQYNEIFYNPIYAPYKQYFKILYGKKMTEYIHMQITREEYLQKVQNLSTELATECE